MVEEQFEKIHREVLRRVRPQKEEYTFLESIYKKFSEKITEILYKTNLRAKITLAGSFSRDTWLSGTRDIDIFIILPYDSNHTPEEVLVFISAGIKLPWIKKHAKHPYLFTIYEGIDIEIIPSYDFQNDRKLRSAVDRTPTHKDFVTKHLPAGANEEVRLLKQFMRGIGVYGAEIKTHGFSGYLVELLIIYHHGHFLEVLKNATKLQEDVITFQKNLSVDRKKFQDDLVVVIDPVDENRNVASPIKEQTLANFIAAAKRYLKTPSLTYFFPQRISITEKVLTEMKNHPLSISAIVYKNPKIADDILWGQIRKLEKSLMKLLVETEVEPITVDSIETDEEIITILLTQQAFSKELQWCIGPPITLEAQEEEYLKKYHNNPEVIYGPTIKGTRWNVLLKRKKQRIDDVIREAIKNNHISIPSHLDLQQSEIILKEQLLEKISTNTYLLEYLVLLLRGKPPYLC